MKQKTLGTVKRERELYFKEKSAVLFDTCTSKFIEKSKGEDAFIGDDIKGRLDL